MTRPRRRLPPAAGPGALAPSLPATGTLDIVAQYGDALAQTLDEERIYELALDGSLTLARAGAGLICRRPAPGAPWQSLVARGLDASQSAAVCLAAEHGTAGLPHLLSLPIGTDPDIPMLVHLLLPAGQRVATETLGALRLLLQQAAVAARNAAGRRQTVAWAQRLARLQTVGSEISANLELSAVLALAIRAAVELVDAAWGVLGLWIPSTRLLKVETARAGSGVFDTGDRVAMLGEGLAGRAAAERTMLAVQDYQRWEHGVARGREPLLRATVAIPLLWQDDLLGVVEVGDFRPGRTFGAEDCALLSLLGQQVGGAIANARLYTRAQHRLHQLTVLQDTSRAIISQLDYDQVVQTVLRNACALFGTQMGAVFVPDAGHHTVTVRATVGLSDRFVRDDPAGRGTAGVARAMSSVKPVAIYDLETDPLLAPAPVMSPRLAFRSILAVPLVHHGQVLGALCVYSPDPRRWTPAEAELLLVFASQAASAMQNALLFDHLRSEKATLATTLQSMTDGIVITDATGAIILANPIADEVFQVPFSAGIGRNLFALLGTSPFPLEYRQSAPVPDLADRIFVEGNPYHDEVTVRRPDPVTLDFNFLPVIGAGYIITGGVAVFHDVTELRRLSEMKTAFLSMVSHELRTPLTSIKGFVKLLLVGDLGPLTPRQRESLVVADGEADRLAHMINELLDISRIEAGRIVFHWEAIPPSEVVTDVLQALQPQTTDRDLAVTIDLPPDLPAVRADRQRLNQILANLLGNAIKFTPPGGGITVRGRAEAQQVVLQVVDTGVGIPPQALAHIFERFYQVEREDQSARGGAGLGLAIVKQLVELHRGQISATSSPGVGTTFTVTLPLATEPAAPSAQLAVGRGQ